MNAARGPLWFERAVYVSRAEQYGARRSGASGRSGQRGAAIGPRVTRTAHTCRFTRRPQFVAESAEGVRSANSSASAAHLSVFRFRQISGSAATAAGTDHRRPARARLAGAAQAGQTHSRTAFTNASLRLTRAALLKRIGASKRRSPMYLTGRLTVAVCAFALSIPAAGARQVSGNSSALADSRVVECRVLEAHANPAPAALVVIFHQRQKQDQPRLA